MKRREDAAVTTAECAAAIEEAPPLRSEWKRVVRVFSRRKLAVAGLAIVVLMVLVAIFAPLLAPYDPYKMDLGQKLLHPSREHPLGTDGKGRDMLAMLISGARISLEVGLLATFIAICIGALIGVLSAYLGGWWDNVLMRFTDIMMTFPFFLLLVLIVFMFGPSLTLIVVVIGLTGWTGAARLIRSEALSLRTRDFVTAARALGASDARIVMRHLIPNVASLIIVMATLSIPGVILAESALSFIGLGDPSQTSWGIILNDGQKSLDTAWWVAVEPGIMLFFTVLAFNFFGDGLRDAFDPKSNLDGAQ